MSLTLQSLTAAARRKTARARKHVEAAEADLHDANKQLERAIPLAHQEELEQAHEQTQRAEQELSIAAKELEIAEQLLVEQVVEAPADKSTQGASGEGIQSLIHKLKP